MPRDNRCKIEHIVTKILRINHPQQLLHVLRYWPPHLCNVQPQHKHEELMRGLRLSLALWSYRSPLLFCHPPDSSFLTSKKHM
jgi:hypothetical protein